MVPMTDGELGDWSFDVEASAGGDGNWFSFSFDSGPGELWVFAPKDGTVDVSISRSCPAVGSDPEVYARLPPDQAREIAEKLERFADEIEPENESTVE